MRGKRRGRAPRLVGHGKPCIRGQRIWGGLVLGMLEGGMSDDETPTAATELRVQHKRAEAKRPPRGERGAAAAPYGSGPPRLAPAPLDRP